MADATDTILKAMKKAGKAVQAGELEKATGLPRKDIDKAMKLLKESGAIVSPKRCYWEPA
ncbi:MAG: MarR family transcriptional regulator [Spirochaetae bacterium HGW-Spirochaetae-10]|nr:MAG: MarR family transcriptional regulator [Spirochaetae bacterium HGW-Spirochaetae-10]